MKGAPTLRRSRGLWGTLLLLAGCALPALSQRLPSAALDPQQTAHTALGMAAAPQPQQHPGHSGIRPLADPLEAFAARMLLAHAAEQSLDVQYYIWRGDHTGTLLLNALLSAAERGVRVRLLLDDAGTAGLDRELAALAQHPRMEVRLFNPFVVRSPKFVGYLTDFGRANRRMHNKAFTADNQASIVGGRNVGDEYFGATDGVLFSDLDVLTVGPIVPEISQDFDRYWASASAWPVQAVLPTPDPAAAAAQRARLGERAAGIAASEQARRYTEAVRQTPLITGLLAQPAALHWSAMHLVSDDPAKGLGQAQHSGLLVDRLYRVLGGAPQRSLALVSPYFVPTPAGTQALVQLSQSGVAVRVLTNAYEASDVPLVHAGYARYRPALLDSGVALYEKQRLAPKPAGARLNPLGSTTSSLHAKTFAVDGERAFVGSFNFDPRSALLNTELGFVIDSPVLAQQIEQAFATQVPAQAYALAVSQDGALTWRIQDTLHATEPGSRWWSRLGLRLLGWLPIEWLL
ncbi:phospholipase D family protein [Pulveribacter sp.]|uniref:phospholipase D family protein n=1 Tax=Pulveribacter sp. TaxID=2678893 RepID=UPI003917DC4A